MKSATKAATYLGMLAACGMTWCDADTEVDHPAPSESQQPTSAAVSQTGELAHELPNGDSWSLVAVAPHQRLIIDVREGDGHRPALIEIESGEVTYLGPPTPGAVFAADADDTHVVWIATTAQDLFTFPWTLWSYSFVSGQSRELARAPDVGVTPVPAAPSRPSTRCPSMAARCGWRLTMRSAGPPPPSSWCISGPIPRPSRTGNCVAGASRAQ